MCHGVGKGKTVSIRKGILSLIFGGLEYQVVRDGQYGEVQPLNVCKNLQFLLGAKFLVCRIDDLTKINGVDIFGGTGFSYFLKEMDNLFIPLLFLEEFQKGVAVENKRPFLHYLNSPFRSFRSFSARDGLGGKRPQAALTGSSTGGIRYMR